MDIFVDNQFILKTCYRLSQASYELNVLRLIRAFGVNFLDRSQISSKNADARFWHHPLIAPRVKASQLVLMSAKL